MDSLIYWDALNKFLKLQVGFYSVGPEYKNCFRMRPVEKCPPQF